MQKLKFEFFPLLHPYRDEQSSRFEIWGRIRLRVDEKILIDHEWDVLEVCEWFFDFKKNYTIDFPYEIYENECIAEYRDRLYSMDNFKSENEEYKHFTRLEEYFSRHVFKLRGTNTNLFYIGIIKSGIGQISFKIAEKYFSYEFDMEHFLIDAEREIIKFIDQWKVKFGTDQALNRIRDLENSLSIKLL